MANTEERHASPRTPSYDGTLSPSSESWWELINHSTGIRYYWNSVTNVTQYERPFCLPPPTTSYLGSSPFKLHQPAHTVQFLQNTNALVPHQQAHAFTVNPSMGFNVNLPNLQDLRVAGAPIQTIAPRMAIGPNSYSGLQHRYYYSPPNGALVYPNRTLMECSDVIDILPTEHAHLASSTSNVPSIGRSKILYLCFRHNNYDSIWWCYDLNLGGGEEIVNENGSKQELITTLLSEPIQDDRSAFIALNSLIYRIYFNGTSPTSRVHVLDIESHAPSWKEFIPLAKARLVPWAVSMGGKIYVVGVVKVYPEKGFTASVTYELNGIEVLTSAKSSMWETLPIHIPNIVEWLDYFVVAFEDHNKLVIGSPRENCLYLFEVRTHILEKIDFSSVCFLPWGLDPSPVVVGNILFFSCGVGIFAFDLVERSVWDCTIVDLDNFFILASCNKCQEPRLIYLGGGKLCLVCYGPHTPDENTSTVHCCVFGVPDFTVHGGKRSLHGHLHSMHKFYIGDAVSELLKVLII